MLAELLVAALAGGTLTAAGIAAAARRRRPATHAAPEPEPAPGDDGFDDDLGEVFAAATIASSFEGIGLDAQAIHRCVTCGRVFGYAPPEVDAHGDHENPDGFPCAGPIEATPVGAPTAGHEEKTDAR
jgi:hypothetical protein